MVHQFPGPVFGYNAMYVATGLLSVLKSDSKTLGLQGAEGSLSAYRKCNFFFRRTDSRQSKNQGQEVTRTK